MKTLITIMLLLVSILGFSQNKHIAKGKARGKSTIVYDGKDVELHKKNCLKKYDENAFNELTWGLPSSERFVYSLYYANKYNYNYASYDIYVLVDSYYTRLNEIVDNADTLYYKPIRMSKECFNFIYAYLEPMKSKYDEEMWKLYKDGIYLPKDTILSKQIYARKYKSVVDKFGYRHWRRGSGQYGQNSLKELHEKYDKNGQQALEDIINRGNTQEVFIKRIIAYGDTIFYEKSKTKFSLENFIFASFIMAYNYHYKQAYKDFAESLKLFFAKNNLSVDDKTARIIKDCLEQ